MESEIKLSACHNASVTEKDGKTICDVCAHECELAVKPEVPASEGTEAKLNPGEKCTLEDGSEGIIAPDGVCVPIATEAEKPKAGELCTLEDGSEGVLVEKDGSFVCEPKPEAAQA